MKQWQELKAQCTDELLFFRLGDFYELFEQDAEIAAPLMGVALTSRRQKDKDAAALCGVPLAHFENYLSKLLNAGKAVALAEQTEEAAGQKLVKREIVQHFTPGIRFYDSGEESFYAAVFVGTERRWSVAAADVATGHLIVESNEGFEALVEICERLPIKDLRSEFGTKLPFNIFQRSLHLESLERSKTLAMEKLDLAHAADLPTEKSSELQALGSLFRVLDEAHPLKNLVYLRPNEKPHAVWMGAATRRHLQLFEPKEHSLFHFIDHCQTAFGRRQLKHWLSFPTNDKQEIQNRQKRVRFFRSENLLRSKIQKELQKVNDLHRLLRRNPKAAQLFQLTQSLSAALKACELLSENPSELFSDLLSRAKELKTLIVKLSEQIQSSDDANEGWISEGVSAELDELRSLQDEAQFLLGKREEALREETGVSTLKIKYHQVFGYVAEVSRQHRDKIPKSAKKLQSLANAERFKTDEIKQIEEKILSLKARIQEAEQALWKQSYQEVEAHGASFAEWIHELSVLDSYLSLATVAEKNQWSTPEIVETKQSLQLESAVHPLSIESFVPLSFSLDAQDCQIMLLSGPNMAGKSTCLRVAALTALLHQIGSDVPAKSAKLSLFDRIMCRMGAMDDMSQGKSTFFVEMKEVASMISGAGRDSLLLFDELGRGTSTFDGMSLAWSITQELHKLRSLSMVATHYLEMASLEDQLERLKNYHLSVAEKSGRLIFTRELKKGPASQSYGIQVAQLADLPQGILDRAREKLKELEQKSMEQKSALKRVKRPRPHRNLSLFESSL